jgi:SAM-dependent methyltransferase
VRSVSSSHYLHGTTPDEQQRLSTLNDLINTAALAEMQLGSDLRILDVGSGLGQLTRAMARRSGPGSYVVGIERSPDQLHQARELARQSREEGLVDFRLGDATQVPLRDGEWGTFDVAHTRFLLEHVPSPLDVVRQMVRANRPGGRVFLQDDAHDILRIAPEPPGFAALWTAYMRSFDEVGNDPLIGHRLVTLLYQAGCTPVRNQWLFFGSCSGQPQLFRAHTDNLMGLILGVRDFVVTAGLLPAGAFDEAIDALREWRDRPDAALWYAVSWAEGLCPS